MGANFNKIKGELTEKESKVKELRDNIYKTKQTIETLNQENSVYNSRITELTSVINLLRR